MRFNLASCGIPALTNNSIFKYFSPGVIREEAEQRVGGEEKLNTIIQEGRVKERGGMVFFPNVVIGSDDVSGQKKYTIKDDEFDDTVLGLGDFKTAGEDPLALLEKEVAADSASASKLAITDGTEKLEKEINTIDELYVMLTRIAKVAKQAFS